MLSRKILHVRSSRSLAGPERHLLELLPGLGAHGFATEVALLYRRQPGDPEEHPLLARLAEAGIAGSQIPDPGRMGLAARRALGARLRRGDLAALHGHDPKSDWVIGGAVRASGRDLPGGPIRRLATLHLYTRATLALRLHRRIDLRLLRSFDGVIAVTAGLAAELEQSVERRAVAGGRRRVARRVIPNGIDAADLRARSAADLPAVRAALAARSDQQGEGRAPLLIAGGRLTRQKGLDLLLEALPAAVARHPGLVLWIAGEGPERPALAAQAARLGLASRVRFLGERGDLAALFSAADAFVLPSRSEGSPYVLLEAMALGLPVVAAAVGGVTTMLADGDRGLLVRAGEPRELAGALLRLLENPDDARRQAEAARQAIAGPLSAACMVEATAAFYAEVLG
ncbi:MAG: glycosyltransferase [Thermoanaerobaculia bacterium]|nr:glycosyltransferase [Thermoanaerobaculia bacterium]MBP9825698.1 glycosyltransferase [Thermoanaerobaculia bacterium]